MRSNQFYCLCCRKAVVGERVKNVMVKNSKRGKVPMARAVCPKCGCKLCKITG